MMQRVGTGYAPFLGGTKMKDDPCRKDPHTPLDVLPNLFTCSTLLNKTVQKVQFDATVAAGGINTRA